MRDLVVTLIVFAGCLYTLKKPYVGILLWSWLSYMNPHRLCWGFAYSMPYAQITAIFVFITLLYTKEKKMFPLNGITFVWIIFILWMGLATIFAYFPDDAFVKYIRIVKIQLICFLTMVLITDEDKLNKLLWVIFISIGYFSVKGGYFTLLTGGGYRVWGPPESFIFNNNSLAVATLMVIPIMFYFYHIYNNKWIKYGMIFSIIGSLFSVIGSQSRGAFVAIIAVGGFYWLKTKHKLLSGFIILCFSLAFLSFMPESWSNRMDTIETYKEDASAMGRINAWVYSFNAANDRLFGVGLDSWSLETFEIYAPNPLDVHAAHSIYFSVMADHGWFGFFLYILIFFMTWRLLSSIIKETNNQENLSDFNYLSKMMQVSFIAYFSGGAFLSLSYFDLPWHMISIVLIIDQLYKKQLNVKLT